IPNAQFDPRVKSGRWDGVIKLYDRRNHQMYLGLFIYLVDFLEKQQYTYSLDPALIPDQSDFLNSDDIDGLIESIAPKAKDGSLLTPYDYQHEAIEHML